MASRMLSAAVMWTSLCSGLSPQYLGEEPPPTVRWTSHVDVTNVLRSRRTKFSLAPGRSELTPNVLPPAWTQLLTRHFDDLSTIQCNPSPLVRNSQLCTSTVGQ